MSLSCNLAFNLTELESYCSQTYSPFTKGQLSIFKGITEKFLKLGKFGNSDPTLRQDWVTVLESNMTEFTDTTVAGTWDSNTKTCTFKGDMRVQIVTSKVGFKDYPQKYVVAAHKEGVEKSWRFTESNDATPQTFSHSLSITFKEILPEELIFDETPTSGLLPKVPVDLFRPLLTKSSAE